MTLLIQLLKLVYPLMKEYGFSNLKLNNGRRGAFTFVCIVTIFLLTLFNIYATEQATRNLSLHKPVIDQYNDLVKENAKLKQQLDSVKLNLYQCESRAYELATSKGIVTADGQAKEYVYDPKSKMIIEKPIK